MINLVVSCDSTFKFRHLKNNSRINGLRRLKRHPCPPVVIYTGELETAFGVQRPKVAIGNISQPTVCRREFSGEFVDLQLHRTLQSSFIIYFKVNREQQNKRLLQYGDIRKIQRKSNSLISCRHCETVMGMKCQQIHFLPRNMKVFRWPVLFLLALSSNHQ